MVSPVQVAPAVGEGAAGAPGWPLAGGTLNAYVLAFTVRLRRYAEASWPPALPCVMKMPTMISSAWAACTVVNGCWVPPTPQASLLTRTVWVLTSTTLSVFSGGVTEAQSVGSKMTTLLDPPSPSASRNTRRYGEPSRFSSDVL